MSERYDSSEQTEVLDIFREMLRAATSDGGKKRAAGTKPSWKIDPDHEAAVWSHINKWKHGELRDPDSGVHPLVHAAWRMLAIAWQETEKESEHCQRCGRAYDLVWAAENSLWNEVVGGYNGLRCPDCFDIECRERGIFPFFVGYREHRKIEERSKDEQGVSEAAGRSEAVGERVKTAGRTEGQPSGMADDRCRVCGASHGRHVAVPGRDVESVIGAQYGRSDSYDC